MSAKSVMIVGVGGQGTLLASRLLGQAMISQGFDVKVSEVHGMSQRGGSVVTYVKYGDKVFSPIVQEAEADFIIAFEQLEAGRWIRYLKNDGKMIINNQQIDPMPVVIGTAEYPQGIVENIEKEGVTTISLDALSLAVKSGSAKAVNVALIGVLANTMEFDKSIWTDAIKATVPEKFLEMNLKAFDLGYNYKSL
ncbi:MAG: indolepyruvate oxidoreductase subunit beta [Oscillospiraceae bacterium]